eukprot:TRINITY_DN687_c1_g1_i1.p1 TRINITY_DN687_c1_g1~~TRINITY_DN687_c1_g1_i1.p1  ORF type:complete len:301 (-),score=43.39 TRINITY_DN687_c1_g1_i1:679-1581(-)
MPSWSSTQANRAAEITSTTSPCAESAGEVAGGSGGARGGGGSGGHLGRAHKQTGLLKSQARLHHALNPQVKLLEAAAARAAAAAAAAQQESSRLANALATAERRSESLRAALAELSDASARMLSDASSGSAKALQAARAEVPTPKPTRVTTAPTNLKYPTRTRTPTTAPTKHPTRTRTPTVAPTKYPTARTNTPTAKPDEDASRAVRTSSASELPPRLRKLDTVCRYCGNSFNLKQAQFLQLEASTALISTQDLRQVPERRQQSVPGVPRVYQHQGPPGPPPRSLPSARRGRQPPSDSER